MTTLLLLSRLHYPVTNLGFGTRGAIWFQGCTIYCRGCISRDTWQFDQRTACDVDDVLEWLRRIEGRLDGVTISGGEPTDQPDALHALLLGIRELPSSSSEERDILVYSGRTYAQIVAMWPWLTQLADLVISEPFAAQAADLSPLRGSSNQTIQLQTDLARRRYSSESLERVFGPQRRQVGLAVEGGAAWLVGIPAPGDLHFIKRRLAEHGIEGRTSWLT